MSAFPGLLQISLHTYKFGIHFYVSGKRGGQETQWGCQQIVSAFPLLGEAA